MVSRWQLGGENMKDKTMVALARIGVGGAILVTSMVTGVNGAYQMLAMFLLGVPVEVLQKKEA